MARDAFERCVPLLLVARPSTIGYLGRQNRLDPAHALFGDAATGAFSTARLISRLRSSVAAFVVKPVPTLST